MSSLLDGHYLGVCASELQAACHTVAVESGTLEFRWVGDNGYEAVNQASITVS